MISGLESLCLPLYQDFILDPTHPMISYFCIFPIAFAASSYILVQSTTDGNLIFWSINMNDENVLTANYETFNVIPGLLMNYRTKSYLKYKNKSFEYRYSVPFLDQLVSTKKLLQNLFNETTKCFVLYDTIVMQFVRFHNDPYFRFVYTGLLDMKAGGLFVEEKTDFDFANGTLVGLVDKKPFFLYNRNGIQTLNLYPFSNYVFQPNDLEQNYVVIGGLNNYFLEPESRSTDSQISVAIKLWKVNFSFELQYQAAFLPSDPEWGYVPLANMIPVPSTCVFVPPYSGPSFIMAFNDSVQPTVAIFGSTQFYNTENTIITRQVAIEFTSDASAYSWTVYPANGPPAPKPCPTQTPAYLYYVLQDDKMIIYDCTFSSFLAQYKGFISIQDLLYSITRNEMCIRYRDITPFGVTESNPSMYNHGYQESNWYFMKRSCEETVEGHQGIAKEQEMGMGKKIFGDSNQENVLGEVIASSTKGHYPANSIVRCRRRRKYRSEDCDLHRGDETITGDHRPYMVILK